MSARLPLVALLLALAACGGKGSPSSPAPSLNLAGTWGGTWTFVTSGVTVSDTVAATLTQSGTGADGTWTSQSGATGQFTNLTPAASTSGTVSNLADHDHGQRLQRNRLGDRYGERFDHRADAWRDPAVGRLHLGHRPAVLAHAAVAPQVMAAMPACRAPVPMAGASHWKSRSHRRQ